MGRRAVILGHAYEPVVEAAARQMRLEELVEKHLAGPPIRPVFPAAPSSGAR
jgi:hypothetical protein